MMSVMSDFDVTLLYPASTYNGGWKNDPSFNPQIKYCRSMGTPKGPDGKSLMASSGYRCGKGRSVYYNGEEADDSVYEGEWDKDKPHGKGKYKNKNGDVYEGDWVDGKKQGSGRMDFHTGQVYEGEFFQDMLHGVGRFTYEKSIYFDKDKEEFVEATDIIEGIWANGELVERVAEYTDYEIVKSSTLHGEAFPIV